MPQKEKMALASLKNPDYPRLLDEDRSRFEAIFHSAMDGIYIVSLQDKKTRMANGTFCRMLEYTPQQIAKLGIEDIHPPDELAGVLETFQRQTSGNVLISYDIPVLKRTGQVFYADISASLVTLDGEACAMGIFRDVTERRQARRDLQYRHDFEKLIMDLSSHFILLKSQELDEAIVDALEKVATFIGADRSYVYLLSEDGRLMTETHEWCGNNIPSQISKHQNTPLESFPWAFNLLKRKEIFHISSVDDLPPEASREKAELQKQGVLSMLAVPMALPDRPFGFLGFSAVRHEKKWSRDTTSLLTIVGEILSSALERRRYEQALKKTNTDLERRVAKRTAELRAEQRQFKELLRDTPAGIAETDLSSMKFVYVNKAMCEFSGYSEKELLGMRPMDMLIDDEDRDNHVARMIAMAAGQPVSMRTEYPVQNKDGETLWIDIQAKLVYENDVPVRVRTVTTDVTARVKTQKELEETKKQLTFKSRKLEEVNEALYTLLDQSMEDKKRLEQQVSGNVEDLIMPYIQRLRDLGLDEDQKLNVNVIETNLRELVSPFSRKISQHCDDLTPREVEVANLVRVGASSSEIAKALDITTRAVSFHRHRLRTKLGLKKKKVNLQAFLASLN